MWRRRVLRICLCRGHLYSRTADTTENSRIFWISARGSKSCVVNSWALSWATDLEIERAWLDEPHPLPCLHRSLHGHSPLRNGALRGSRMSDNFGSTTIVTTSTADQNNFFVNRSWILVQDNDCQEFQANKFGNFVTVPLWALRKAQDH